MFQRSGQVGPSFSQLSEKISGVVGMIVDALGKSSNHSHLKVVAQSDVSFRGVQGFEHPVDKRCRMVNHFFHENPLSMIQGSQDVVGNTRRTQNTGKSRVSRSATLSQKHGLCTVVGQGALFDACATD